MTWTMFFVDCLIAYGSFFLGVFVMCLLQICRESETDDRTYAKIFNKEKEVI